MGNPFKRYKFLHWAYNLIHYRSLSHNKAAYRKYDIHKPVIASISSKDFPDKTSRAWLDTGHSRELVSAKPAFRHFPPAIQQQLKAWSDKGYLVWNSFLDDARIDSIQKEVDSLVRRGKLRPTHDNKLLFANRHSALIREVTREKRLMELLGFILDKEVVPFQTINFTYGSNQRAHSDSIHMTTYPLGYLIAVWIALEDTHPDNGPLFYYPGSHRLPYLLNSDFNEGETALQLGKKDYVDYEDRIAEQIRERSLQPEVFLAKKGDLLIWHANLIHGGMPVQNPALTRKSMVIHYYAKDVVKYHEITERPSLLK
ncbi:phytanoyl-CoA dioxygenase family protein [Flavitalea sp. BT771]|uniref:phytanoyl-CoA dioxygenase family protein n=1 Tax=Flavitalea sp. BT771 TaxID=3063329 RepID=UPI0026E159E3|nr:phytanoyl-CoA dioxygenase family protein [Flavitalea sp. BT771]MDO6433991.1 phytanoyl-CoA dioxygenase family protein [Flavitalea sp. BT771]MDV6222891.1 phytanoyl-CoA dioxygenase family protein [Flavitalea sp. BT771]